MLTNERSGVAAEQCVNCQWIFVGRVELEALLAVKARYEQARAEESVGAPLYEALASGADYAVDYRADHRTGYTRPSSRPNLRVVPSLPPDPPTPPSGLPLPPASTNFRITASRLKEAGF